jgi:hydrogenase expression/formation protein HypC
MCLSTPAKIIDIKGEMADVSVGGAIFKAGLQMVENIEVGDWILLHTGFAIQKIDEKEAIETLNILRDIKNAMDK